MNSSLTLFLLGALAGLFIAGCLFLLWKSRNERPKYVAPTPQAGGTILTVNAPAPIVDQPPPKVDQPPPQVVEPPAKTVESHLTYHLYKDAAGEWRWNLKSASYEKIADSGEGYHNKKDCLHGIDLVKASSTAPVKEQEARLKDEGAAV